MNVYDALRRQSMSSYTQTIPAASPTAASFGGSVGLSGQADLHAQVGAVVVLVVLGALFLMGWRL